MTIHQFRRARGDREWEFGGSAERAACIDGDCLTVVPEPSDGCPNGVRVYLHPSEVDLHVLSPEERSAYRGPWFACCPGRCDAVFVG